MDAFAPEGILPNVLRWADRPGQAFRNILRGNPAAAGRQALDFFGEGADALLPGDWIPQATGQGDYVSGSELVGMDQNTPSIGRTAADIGVGLVTDPLAFLSFGLTGTAKAAAKAGQTGFKPTYGVNVGVPFMGATEREIPGLNAFDKPVDPLSLAMRGVDTGISKTLAAIDGKRGSATVAGQQTGKLSQGYQDLKDTIRRAAGAEDLSSKARLALQAAAGTGSQAARLYSGQAQDLLKGLPQDERILLGKAFYGVDLGDLNLKNAGQATPLTGNLMADVDTLARKYGKDSAKLQKIAAGIDDIGKRQFDEAVASNAMVNPIDHYVVNGEKIKPDDMRKLYQEQRGPALQAAGKPDEYQRFLSDVGVKPVLKNGRENYLQRQWLFEGDDVLGREMAGNGAKPNALKASELTTPQQRADFFNKGDVGVELDPAKLLIDRASQQGEMLKRAQVAKTFGGTGTLADDLTKTALDNIEADVKAGALTKDDGVRLAQALQGMPARTGLFKSLAGANKLVKGAMVYGVVIPKFGSLVRNKLGMGFQALATPNARNEFLTHVNPATLVNDMARSFDEAYGELMHGSKSWARSDELGKDISLIDEAFKNAKQTKDVSAYLIRNGRDDLADAVNHGVMDGFVSTEELVKKIANSPDRQKWLDLVNAPGVMFQALEQRGRLQTFKNLRGKHGGAGAARLTKDAMFDYDISSPENRMARDFLPFFQFAAKSTAQQGKLLSTKPAAAVATAPLFYDVSGEDQPVYPYMQGQSRVGVGQDAAGNDLYLTGFGLPMESINMVPNLSGNLSESGRSVSHGLLSSTQPLLKTGAAIVTGKDPYFGSQFGSYDRIPVVGHAGQVGRVFNMMSGTGVLEPFGGGILRQIGQATDETKPIAARIADIATGAKLTAVDSDRAEQQQISNYLDSRPDISQFRSFYQAGEQDPELAALMTALRESKARSKEKRAAAAASAP